MPPAEELVQSCPSIPTLPELYTHVQIMVEAPDSTSEPIAACIKQDPALSAALLRAANNPLYGCPSQVETISDAIRLLGPQTATVVATATVGRTFSGIPVSLMDVAKFWRKSLLCALLAGKIAAASGIDQSERLYVAGLFRDIGHAVLYQTVPQRVHSALIEASYLEASLADVEQSNIGCDFAEVGGEWLRWWGLPLALEQAIRWQLDPDKAGAFVLQASIVHLAGAIVDYHEEMKPPRRPPALFLHPGAVAAVRFVPSAIPTLLAEAQAELQQTLHSISPLAQAA
ncbi:MAG: HDOD domain-containing protein [Nitrospira sp.]|nr:HDOD domain-containing protein [Nitrospira sp.]